MRVRGTARPQASNGTVSKTTAMKKDIHPKFYADAKARKLPGCACACVRPEERPRHVAPSTHAPPCPAAQIFCNGVEVMTCGGVKPEYVVDVWSGNHPFFQGNKTAIVVDDGRVSRFNKMYGDLSETLGNVKTIKSAAGEPAAAKAEAKPAAAKAPPKKKK